MNGECKSYRLNDPMSWAEFKKMPDDIQVTYITALRKKYSVSDTKLAEMFGVSKDVISRQFKRLGLDKNKTRKHVNWDKDGFYAWWHGVEQIPVPVNEEEPVQEESPVIANQEPEYVEEDLPFDIVPVEEPGCVSTFVPMEQCAELEAENALLKAQIDGLQKANDALMAVNEKVKAENEWLRTELENNRMNVRILEAQMEVVRMIFGGKNNA